MKSLGIDVGGVRKGLDLVIVDGRHKILVQKRRANLGELRSLVAQHKPDIVAIDSPPAWASTGWNSRHAERELVRLGVHSFATPSAPDRQKSSFYDWMREGFKVFRTLAGRFPRYRSGSVTGTAIEVFPHASAVFLSARKRPRNIKRHHWRKAILQREGIESAMLGSKDQIDAALAALTGLYALRGKMKTFGRPNEGVIVVPDKRVPTYKSIH